MFSLESIQSTSADVPQRQCVCDIYEEAGRHSMLKMETGLQIH